MQPPFECLLKHGSPCRLNATTLHCYWYFVIYISVLNDCRFWNNSLRLIFVIFTFGLSSSVHTNTSVQLRNMLGFSHAIYLFRPIVSKLKKKHLVTQWLLVTRMTQWLLMTQNQDAPDTRAQWWESFSRFFICYLMSFSKILCSWAPPVMVLFNRAALGMWPKVQILLVGQFSSQCN